MLMMGKISLSDKMRIQTLHELGLGYRTRNSSGDEIANMNFLYDDIVHEL